jgi:hypothetical protein
LFGHLTGHAPGYFAERLPGTLASRVTATSNAAFTVENVFVWNVLPPCAATVGAILFIATVSVPMAPVLMLVADPSAWLPDLTVRHLRIGTHKLDIRFWREGEETAFEVTKGDLNLVERYSGRTIWRGGRCGGPKHKSEQQVAIKST